MSLVGMDISSYQSTINVGDVPADFVIVKATGGNGYVNKHWEWQVQETLDSGKLLGIYHYAWENGFEDSAKTEAWHFLNHVKHLKGLFVPALDVEDNAVNLDAGWYKEWMDIVSSELGSDCLFYTGAYVVNHKDLDIISNRPLWMASYLYKYYGSGFLYDPYNPQDTGPWENVTVYQYTGTGDVPGYDGNLDLDVFYGTKTDWNKLCGKPTGQQPGQPVNNAGIKYQVHSQNYGWLPQVRDGQVAGTTGESLRMEAIKVDPPEGWELVVKAHIQNDGWKIYRGIVHGNDIVIGTTGQAKRLEMLSFDVVKSPAGSPDLQFQVHQQNVGWKGLTKQGYFSGTDGEATRLEALRLQIGG